MRKLISIFLLWTLVLAPARLVAQVVAQQSTPVAGQAEYRDPANRFTSPVPANWTVEEHDDYAVLRAPDGDLAAYLLVVVADSVAAAGLLALRITGLDPGDLPDTAQTVPSAAGIDETTVITYVSSDELSIIQVIGQRIGNLVYCIVFAGTIDAAVKRDSQVQIIAGGFKITSLVEIDLSNTVPNEITPALLLEFQSYVSDLQERLDVPGASVAIVAGGKVVFARGFGVKELGGTDPVDADTLMMIGSVTKSMTTMMMATEIDAGLLSWDEPAVSIVPEFAVADPELTQSITVRHLVCACTGVPRRDLEFIFNAGTLSAEDVIASLADFQFYTGFGEAFQYSNQMVATGGYVAAAAAGGVYGDLYDAYVAGMQSRVFDPIGMTSTTFSSDEAVAGGNHATPHGANLDAAYEPIPLSLENVLVPVAPAGLAWSSANDMARYLLTEIGGGVSADGTRVVSERNLGETWEPQVAVDATTSYGLGWFVQDYHGLKLIHHGGNTFGFTSDLAFLPDEGIGIVVLANGQGANAFSEGVRFRLLELLYDLPHEYDAQIDYALSQAEGAYAGLIAQLGPIPAEVARDAEGTYRSDTLGVITLVVIDGELVLNAGEFQTSFRLYTGAGIGGDVIFVAEDPPIPGTPFTLRTSVEGCRELVLEFGTETYIFAEIPAQGAPACPPASPVAGA